MFTSVTSFQCLQVPYILHNDGQVRGENVTQLNVLAFMNEDLGSRPSFTSA